MSYKMKYCGIVLVKSDSKRLKNKNFLEINNQQVFEFAIDALQVDEVDGLFLFSDKTNRPPPATLPDEPIFSALKWAYKSLPQRYDAIINIMANCPEITSEDVSRAVARFEELDCDELRSFNSDGSESGLIIVKEGYLLNKHEISTYQGAITIESKEIHTKKDLEGCRERIEKSRT